MSRGYEFVNLLDPDYIESFRDRQHKPVDSVPTPFPGWNAVCGGDGGREGLARGWFVVVGGNPKRGKTLLSLNMAIPPLSKTAEPVVMMSLEMGDPELAARFYAMLGQQKVYTLERGRSFSDDALDAAVGKIRQMPVSNGLPRFFVNAEPIFDLQTVLGYMQDLHDRHGVRWFIIDYLQLVSMDDDDEAVRTCTRAVKEFRRFAKLTGSVVIALSQFKRTVSEDYTSSPMPQGLFGGGAIEQTADQIALIDHSLFTYDRTHNVARTWLRLTNRHGQHGDFPILWNYNDLTCREGLADEESDWPTREKGRRKSR